MLLLITWNLMLAKSKEQHRAQDFSVSHYLFHILFLLFISFLQSYWVYLAIFTLHLPYFLTTVKPLNDRHLRVLKNLSVIKRCPQLGRSLTKIVTFGTNHFVRYSRHVHYLRCPLMGGFTVYQSNCGIFFKHTPLLLQL